MPSATSNAVHTLSRTASKISGADDAVISSCFDVSSPHFSIHPITLGEDAGGRFAGATSHSFLKFLSLCSRFLAAISEYVGTSNGMVKNSDLHRLYTGYLTNAAQMQSARNLTHLHNQDVIWGRIFNQPESSQVTGTNGATCAPIHCVRFW